MKRKRIINRVSLMLAYILYLSCIFTTQAKADIYPGGFASGHLSYGIGGGSSSNVDAAAAQWNGTGLSTVSLTRNNTTNTYGPVANIVTYCGTHEPPTSGDLGEMIPYKAWTGTSATPAGIGDTWNKAIVYQYANSALSTTTRKIATITHELGHCLALAHPTNSPSSSIMYQGVKDSYAIAYYDITELIRKWSN